MASTKSADRRPITQADLVVSTLGPCTIPSPLELSTVSGDLLPSYVPDDARVAFEVELREGQSLAQTPLFEKAGPRQSIHFAPQNTRAAIVTCGGLCPGINNVVRSIVLELHHKYGVREIFGVPFGFEGLDPVSGLSLRPLGPNDVRDIHKLGGSVLGLSRGKREASVVVDTLVRERIDLLFCIGGDGTLKGAHAIAEEIAKRGLKIGVVGVPKTIDNDVPFVDKTFGFETAVDVARRALDAMHTEALGARNGVGLVKLMGRDAGFVVAAATLASAEVNFCLIPEVPFDLDGPHGLLAALEARLAARGHALIVVAEGCGAHLAKVGATRDASGNLRYASDELDVGPRLQHAIEAHFAAKKIPLTLKYVAPSYLVRSVPASSIDASFCDQLARCAVHAAMAGKTDVLIGRIHRVFTHVPLATVGRHHRRVSPDGETWLSVTETTGQPRLVAPPGA